MPGLPHVTDSALLVKQDFGWLFSLALALFLSLAEQHLMQLPC